MENKKILENKISEMLERIVKPLRNNRGNNYFICMCCGDLMKRSEEGNKNRSIGKSFFNYELCCECGNVIKKNQIKKWLLRTLEAIIDDISNFNGYGRFTINDYRYYLNVRDYLHLR